MDVRVLFRRGCIFHLWRLEPRQERLRADQETAQETSQAQKKRAQEEELRQKLLQERAEESSRLEAVETSVRELQQRLQELKHQVEWRVTEPGAELKSAPFRAGATLERLAAHSELVVLIVTPHWYGVETPDGHHGWIHRRQVEPLP